MEGCPKLPMFSYDLKIARESSNFSQVIKKLIRLQYNENPEDFNSEVEAFAKLRNTSCVYIQSSNSELALDNMKMYYCQLTFFKNRFQILDTPLMKKGPFDFPWTDVVEDPLNPFAMSMHADLESEMAIVFYNIGILHSNLGNKEERLSSESMKTACNHYQHAAGIFHSLPDIFKLTKNVDFNADSLAVMSYIALAQAQECILEKSILDNRKANSIVKVGATVVDFYKQSWKKISSSTDELHEVCSRDWVKYLSKFTNFKMCYYNAIANFFAGVAAEEDSKWGESVAYLTRAEKSLNHSIDTVKSNSILGKVVTQATLQFAMDVIVGKCQIAKRENEFIYHDKVPDSDNLPELKGQALVKGFPFDVNQVAGKDIFHKLIPLEAHAASSMYSEEKAKILRDLSTKIEAKDEELVNFMLSMNLEQVPNAGDHIALPQELIESAAGLSGVHENPIKKLSGKMAKLAGISADVQASLDEVQAALDEQTVDKKEKVWLEELKKYLEIHKVASESNAKLHQAIQVHVDNLKILSKPLDELQEHVPSMANLDAEAEKSIAEFQRIVKKVDEMKNQRVQLMDELRDDILHDDITKKLVIHKENEMPKLFETELTKHDTKIKFLEQNLKAQGNIIQAMTEVNAKYVPTRRKVADLIQNRKDKISSLVETFEAYESLNEKVSKAVEFYEKLAKNTSDLQTKVQKSVVDKKKEAKAALDMMTKVNTTVASKPTLKDYLGARSTAYPGYNQAYPQAYPNQQYPGYQLPQSTQPGTTIQGGNSQYSVPNTQGYHTTPQNTPHYQVPQSTPQGYQIPVTSSNSGTTVQTPSGYQHPYQYPNTQVPPNPMHFPSGYQQPQQHPGGYQGYQSQQQQQPSQNINPNDLSLI